MNKKIITVLGRVDPEEFGRVDAHNHLWINDLSLTREGAPVLDQEELIVAELKGYKSAGGSGQVDCQPGGAGRNANKLELISRASGVQIVACTGFHLREYYPQESKIWDLDSNQAADYFLEEIHLGMIETRSEGRLIYPGFIKIAVSESLEKSPRALLEGAIAASLDTGYLIEMHTEKGAGVEEFCEYFSRMGLPQNRVVICHIDKRPDPGLHKDLAAEGYLLEYDTFFRPKYDPDKYLWALLREMVEEGLAGSIACATDLADKSLWESYGGSPGLAGFIRVIDERLKAESYPAKVIEQLMGKNITGRLAVN